MLNRPETKITTTTEKTVKFSLSVEEHSAALNAYLKRAYSEFRNIDISYVFNEDGTVECNAHRIKI